MAGENFLRTQQYLKTLDNDKCSNTIAAENSSSVFEKMQLTLTTNCTNSEFAESPKVIYVNPNYGRIKHVIHINPNIHANVSMHVNAKLNSKTSTHLNSNVSTKKSIYLNPKIVKNMDVIHHLQKEENKSISKIEKNTPSEKKIVAEHISYTVCSELNVKSVIQKKSQPSNVIPLPCTNVIRLKRYSKGASSTSIATSNKVKRISGTGLKIANVKDSAFLSTKSGSCQLDNLLQFVKCKNKVSQYKFDKMVVQKRKTKSSGFTRTEKLRNSMKLVSIGGISYKSSKNQLVRRTSTNLTKRKRIISREGHEQFSITSDGKVLLRLNGTRKCQTHMNHSGITVNRSKTTLIRRKSIPLVKQNLKGNISNKVKQRSIQILRNKMRKNNQPCLFFQKFGYCANQDIGKCHKVHDKKQVALCKNFLQGKCILDLCGLSHDVGPEKMPTCKYFLEGCCTRDACPYLHVKVSASTPICHQFLQGYCEKGNKCKQRHIYICPEFEKAGNCSKSKHCPYPHKSKTSKISSTLQKRSDMPPFKVQESTVVTVECRKRYYDNCSDDLGKKREHLFQKLEIVKFVRAGQSEESINDKEISDSENGLEHNKERDLVLKGPKRPPIGPLPSYIPIN
ncbi:zinc finger CCCH domain-containing protein 7 isoform X2 [Belonocnema kinseyi]|uniref:zinc finger CCCH domain-containing protein 7 isoform X2 n=1 Tax=Belonocnema kinseyi TaxID=2817044 RepID=UPI00143DB54E|nr:zinc finger CCCH domain-containing protein 7 isoform X2 [Belonocnema kinseyi]